MKIINKTFFVTKELINMILMISVFTVLPIAVFTLISFKMDILFGFKSFVVLTGSMSPLIPAGSIVYSQKLSSYNLGDIVTFEQKKGVNVTHRIADIKRQDNKMVYITRGDANSVNDSTVITKDQIIGKTQFHFPAVGKFLADLKSLKGFIAFIALPIIAFVLLELWNIIKELEKGMRQKLLKEFQKMQERQVTSQPIKFSSQTEKLENFFN